jgi:hypothetical protein
MIYIFVVPEEYELYKNAFPLCNVVQGKNGLCNQRNCISDYFPEGFKIVSMDDDIKDIIVLKNNQFISLDNFTNTMADGFNELEKQECSLFGFYPVLNKMFMKQTISSDFRFIIGSCFGYMNRKIVRTLTEKDDYEFSLLNYLNDKKVLRYNYISIKSNYYTMKGGLQSFKNRLSEQEIAVKYLIDKYPEYFALKKHSYKSGFPELRVKRIK